MVPAAAPKNHIDYVLGNPATPCRLSPAMIEYDLENTTVARLSKLRLIWDFLKVRKKWWLAPIILFVLLLSLLIVFAEGSALAPFIYTIF